MVRWCKCFAFPISTILNDFLRRKYTEIPISLRKLLSKYIMRPFENSFNYCGYAFPVVFGVDSMTTIFQVRLFFSYLLCAQKNLSRIDSFFTLCKSIQLTICDMSRVLHFLCLVFFCGLQNFIVFIEWLGRKLIVFCVSVCLPHTPIQIWRLHLEKKVVLHLETILRGDALHMAKNFSANWCNGRSFTHLMGSSTLSFKAKHKNKWEAMTAMAIDHNGAHLRNSYSSKK